MPPLLPEADPEEPPPELAPLESWLAEPPALLEEVLSPPDGALLAEDELSIPEDELPLAAGAALGLDPPEPPLSAPDDDDPPDDDAPEPPESPPREPPLEELLLELPLELPELLLPEESLES